MFHFSGQITRSPHTPSYPLTKHLVILPLICIYLSSRTHTFSSELWHPTLFKHSSPNSLLTPTLVLSASFHLALHVGPPGSQIYSSRSSDFHPLISHISSVFQFISLPRFLSHSRFPLRMYGIHTHSHGISSVNNICSCSNPRLFHSLDLSCTTFPIDALAHDVSDLL